MERLGLLFQLYDVIHKLSRRNAWKDLDTYPNQDYSIWTCLKIFLAYSWMGWTRHLFYSKLKSQGRNTRRLLRLPSGLPSESQLGKRIGREAFEWALLGLLRENARDLLRALGEEEVRVTMLDLTAIPSSRRDRKAKLGTDGKHWFWGYKVGLFTSRSGVVLGAAVVTANLGERHVTAKLLRLGEATLSSPFGQLKVQYLLADAGFAGEATYRDAHRRLHARAVIPPRKKANPKRRGPSRREEHMKWATPHRYRDWRFWKTPTAKRVYRQRADIERRLSQLTDAPFFVDRRPRGTVGVAAVLRYSLSKLIFWNQALWDNIAHGRETLRVKPYAA